MPPRTSKRRKQAEASNPLISGLVPPAVPGPCPATNLPQEMLLEVVSHFDFIPIDYRNGEYLNLLPPSALERVHALRAMSQTCKHWRGLFWPLLWENFEVLIAGGKKDSGTWYDRLNESLVRKCGGLVANPAIAVQVRGLRVGLTNNGVDKSVEALVKALCACQNLRILNVFWVAKDLSSTIRAAFKGYTFSSVETILLPNPAHSILRSCPNITTVKVNASQKDTGQVLGSIKASCKKVEACYGFGENRGANPDLIKRLVKTIPKLQVLSFAPAPFTVWPTFGEDELRLLKPLKDLRTVELAAYAKARDDDIVSQYAHGLKTVFGEDKGSIRVSVTNVPDWVPAFGENNLVVKIGWEKNLM